MRSMFAKTVVLLLFGFGSVVLIIRPIFEAVVPKFDIEISVAAARPDDEPVAIGHGDRQVDGEATSARELSLLKTNVRVVKVVPVNPDGSIDFRYYHGQ